MWGLGRTSTEINNRGEVCGWSSSVLFTPQLREPDGTWVYLGGIPSKLDYSGGASDINDDDRVVGVGVSGDLPRAFLWRPGLGIAVLDDFVDDSGKGWSFGYAKGISKHGMITGSGRKKGDTGTRAFLLVPHLRPSAKDSP